MSYGLVVSPWLAGVKGDTRFDVSIYHLLDSAAMDISSKMWTDDVKVEVYGARPIPDRLARTAVYEVSASTAVSMAHDLTGSNDVNEELARLALAQLNEYVDRYGFGSLVIVYGYITSYENHHAVAYYGKLPERDFVRGSLHRPWVDYSLSDELLFSIYLGNYKVTVIDQVRYVELTPHGYETLKDYERILEQSGYFEKKVKQLQISNFNVLDKYDEYSEQFWPNAAFLRNSFLNWVHISPGMRVLELGCADGIFAFEGGLAERIGKNGLLVGIDSSAAMIARANHRLSMQSMDWVHFYKTRAEDLPFLEDSFDAVIGIGVWHFLQFPEALQEVYRVLKPGGIFASFHPTNSSFVHVPFFKEWFEPLLRQANMRNQEKPLDYLPVYEQAQFELEQNGFVNIAMDRREMINYFVSSDLVIDHLILGVGYFQEELSLLPWKAREDMIDELRRRGVTICEKYPDSERILHAQIQFIKGNRPL